MAKLKVLIIKAVFSLGRLLDADFLMRLYKIYDGLLNNPAYPKPPVDLATYKTTVDSYASSVQAALDGGKAAKTLRDKMRAACMLLYHQLGHYVEVACKNDMNTFVSSGFQAAVRRQKSAPVEVDVPVIVEIAYGPTGRLLVKLKKVPKAVAYKMRYATASAVAAAEAAPGGPGVNWTVLDVTKVRPATPIDNLTPGTIYTFQACAHGPLGFSEWSNAVNKMAA